MTACERAGEFSQIYALKLLQSDDELTIASTGKDEASGNLVTKGRQKPTLLRRGRCCLWQTPVFGQRPLLGKIDA
jgi:hypothetical protein